MLCVVLQPVCQSSKAFYPLRIHVLSAHGLYKFSLDQVKNLRRLCEIQLKTHLGSSFEFASCPVACRSARFVGIQMHSHSDSASAYLLSKSTGKQAFLGSRCHASSLRSKALRARCVNDAQQAAIIATACSPCASAYTASKKKIKVKARI